MISASKIPDLDLHVQGYILQPSGKKSQAHPRSSSVDEKTAVLRPYSKGEEKGRERNKGREEARRNEGEMGRRGENMENI